MNVQEAVAAWRADQAMLASLGAVFPEVRSYVPDGAARDYTIAMDAQPTLFTEANSAIPAFLATTIDPQVFRVLFAPTNAAKILGEVKKGDWLQDTIMFPIVEHVGEVSSYGDYSENGHTGVNTNWPQRQNYLYQTIEEMGDREVERAGLGRINWKAEMDVAAATVMNRFANLTYFLGIAGLQNYGLLNNPGLSAALTPAAKAYGGVKWIVNGVIVATANEIYADIQSLYLQLVAQSGGLIQQDSEFVLAMSPGSQGALTATNSFNVNVTDLLKKNFPNIRIEVAVQYGALSSSNPQGVAAGNFIQLIATNVEGQQTGFAAFSEKMHAFPIVRAMSSYKQKLMGGSWGAVIRAPYAVSSMVGM
jgi:hypothetical protein